MRARLMFIKCDLVIDEMFLLLHLLSSG